MTPPHRVSLDDLPGNLARRFEGREHRASISFFVGSFPPGRGPELHRHPYEETFIVLEGSATVWADGQSFEVSGGEVMVVPAGAAHRFTATGEEPMRHVSIHPADRMAQEWVED